MMYVNVHAHMLKMANGVGLPLRGHVPPVPKDQDPWALSRHYEPARWHYTSWSRARNSQEH